ncbi:hypothetical protein EDB84DRAFT_1571086 [Lactarius hengduanensis]|nr:hypothetical protein EDB84DRAFT_1571086 [Lactarius hengduanensis]
MAESSESPTASPDVIKIAGPLLFGPLFNWGLYGVLCVQIYVYSYNFPKDKRSVKFLAYFVFFVNGFGDAEHLARSGFSPIDSPIITAVISPIVQGYFCYRIWTLNRRSLWVCWIIAVAAVTQSIAGMWAGIESLTVRGYLVTKTALFAWSIPSALADILIAVAMTLLVRHHHMFLNYIDRDLFGQLRSASSKFTNFVLIRVVRLTIETNTLTASLAITTIVLYAAFPNELYYMTKVIGKVYSNTLLVSLNNRIYFRDHQPPEQLEGDNPHLTVSGRVRATVLSSLRFSVPEPQPRTPTPDNFPLYPVPRPGKQDASNGDDTSTD